MAKSKKDKNIDKWAPDDFNLEISSVWGFPDRGNWATHTAKYRGNWSPFIPRNIILRYAKEGELVLDQFAGSGTTLIEAKLLGRNCMGVDINPLAVELCKNSTGFDIENAGEVSVRLGDARKLDFLEDKSVDLICTHPPYANIIRYSEDLDGDLSHYDVDKFYEQMEDVAKEAFRVLKKDKFCAILMGDTRKKGHIIPMGFSVMEIFKNAGFKLKEIIIKEQHNCSSTGFWKSQSIKHNFFLIMHEYLFIFKKH